MECPKCSYNIDDNAIVCPNCKKVLKLICPVCKTVNKTNTCHKCGFVIVNKCHKCGKVNQTIIGKCKKCGFDTNTSVIMGESNTDDFACLTIDFPNLDDVKAALGTPKLFTKFSANLNKLIFDFANSIGVRRQIIDKTYIFRFNKDYTFNSSAEKALKATVILLNNITKLNFKLSKLKDTQVQCNMAILKRDINAKNEDYKAGVNIKMVYQNTAATKLLNSLQVITDQSIYDSVGSKYDLSPLNASMVKNEMVMFFELNTKRYIEIPEEEPPEEEEEITLPKFIEIEAEDYEIEDDRIYDIESINFDELKCNFIKTESVNLYGRIAQQMRSNKKRILSIKADKRLAPCTLRILRTVEYLNQYKSIIRVTCHEDMKYKPYGFFNELISNIYNYCVSTNNFSKNNFAMFKDVDPSGFIKDLISMNYREFPHPEDTRYSLFDIFGTIFYSMEDTLIYIENFENIDETSYEVLQILFQKFDELDVSYLISYDKEFSLHKNSHFLLSKDYYTEVSLKPTKFNEFIEPQKNFYKNILDTFYIQKIAQYTKGSFLYLAQATQYLLECGILGVKENALFVENQQTIILPTSLDELVKRRLRHLSKDHNAFKLLSYILFIGPRIDYVTLQSLNIPVLNEEIKKLETLEYIYIFNDAVYVQNFNLYRDNLFSITTREDKQQFATELLVLAFSPENIPMPVKAFLQGILEHEKKEFIEWEALSALSTSMGDFSAFLNCSIKFLKLIDNNIDENSEKTIEEYKLDVYENISNLLYKYTPEKIYNIANIILDNLEKATDDKKVINLCNKMLQGCLISGNYTQALQLSHKILSRLPHASLSPQSEYFNIGYFLVSVVKVEVLFNIGDLEDCIELGEEILKVLNAENLGVLKPENLSQPQFIELLFDTMGFVAIAKVIQLKDDLAEFLQRIQEKLGNLPPSFELFIKLQETLHGQIVSVDESLANDSEKFSRCLVGILNAFNVNKEDYNKFASDIYQAKISAKALNLHQLELFCDLFIGYSYFKLDSFKKANSIYHNVLQTSNKNGLKNVTYFAWYLMAELEFAQGEIDMAYGISNNAAIQLEKNPNCSDIILMLFKLNLHKVLTAKGDESQAEFCLKHAMYISEKNNLKISMEVTL